MTTLSPAQKRLVAKIEAGCGLSQSFDVWGGYHFHLKPNRVPVPTVTVNSLVDKKVLVRGETVRLYSGYHETPYTLVQP